MAGLASLVSINLPIHEHLPQHLGDDEKEFGVVETWCHALDAYGINNDDRQCIFSFVYCIDQQHSTDSD